MNDPLTFLEEIASAAGPYQRTEKLDRHRDFRAALMDGNATPEQCKRVLWELFAQTGMFLTPLRASENLLDLDKTFSRLGKQDLGRWLYDVLTQEPKPME